jgi:CheY-like chemotaxis protein
MDVQMPELDGLAATRAVRAPGSRAQNPAVPIIALTAHARDEDRRACLAAGMNDYASKPVSAATLARLLEVWLPGSRRSLEPSTLRSAALSIPLPDAPLATFDEAGLVARVMGDRQLARTVACGFCADIGRQIDLLIGHLEAGDVLRVERQAHTLTGAATAIGAARLAALADDVGRAARSGDIVVTSLGCERLREEVTHVLTAMSTSRLLGATKGPGP